MNNIKLEKHLQGFLDRAKLCFDEVMNGSLSASEWNEEQEWEELPCPDGKAEARVTFNRIMRHSVLEVTWESEHEDAAADVFVSYDGDTELCWNISSIERGVEGSVSYILYELVSELNEEEG